MQGVASANMMRYISMLPRRSNHQTLQIMLNESYSLYVKGRSACALGVASVVRTSTAYCGNLHIHYGNLPQRVGSPPDMWDCSVETLAPGLAQPRLRPELQQRRLEQSHNSPIDQRREMDVSELLAWNNEICKSLYILNVLIRFSRSST